MTCRKFALAILLVASLVAGAWAGPQSGLPARASQAQGPVQELVSQIRQAQGVKPLGGGRDAFKVVVAGAEIGISNLARMLQDSSGGDFTVDTLQVRSGGSQTLRNIDSLIAAGVACIITFTDYQYYNATQFGDSLAKFVDAGGGVVITVFADYSPWNIAGAFATRYMPVPFTSNTYTSGTLGTVHVPSHPLMAGVTTVGCGNYKTGATAITSHNGTVTRIADWSGGQVECAAMDSAGRRVVWLGFFGYGNWIGNLSGQWCRQMINAIRWTSVFHDVQVKKLLAPMGAYDSGAVVTPACSVYNSGNQLEIYYMVRLRIGSHVDSAEVFNHTPGTAQYVEFGNWEAAPRGRFDVSCSTELTIDLSLGNDAKRDSGFVNVKDIASYALVVPTDSYPKDTVVRPRASWRNCGTQPAGFEAWMLLADSTNTRVYSQRMPVPSLAPGATIDIASFPQCTLKTVGHWTVRCSAYMVGDVYASNDLLDSGFTVVSGGPPPPPPPPPGSWVEKTKMPTGAKAIKDGGWLAADAGMGKIYASRGNKQPDFYAYSPSSDSWKKLADWLPGSEGKLPSKSSAGCANGHGVVYAVKGNNTPGFWKYDDSTNAWTQKANVPLGVSNKKLKGGSDIAFVYKGAEGYAYLLKGYKNEFYRYDPAGDSWHALPDAPAGASIKYDKGSWLAYDGEHTLFAHKAKYHEFYKFDTDTDAWDPAPLVAMPIPGSAGSKKSKDGGCGTYYAEFIYALKGGNTNEFWAYNVPGNAWVPKDDIPLAGSTSPKKKVKAGADITAAGGNLYATKGNKCDELWMYGLTTFGADVSPQHDGVAAGATSGGRWMTISPNPLATGYAVLRYALPRAGAAGLSVYDVAGQRVMATTLTLGRSGSANLDLRHLAGGVYLVKLSGNGFATSQKLVVQK